MNILIEENQIKEITCNSDFIYLLLADTKLSVMEYKVLQNQEKSGFLRCMRMKLNGSEGLYYLTENYKNLKSLLVSLDAEAFHTIISNLFYEILAVKNNGFLTVQNLDIDPSKIYIDLSTYKVRLVYIPSYQHVFRDSITFENVLRTTLIKIIDQNPKLNSDRVAQLSLLLASGTMNLQDIYQSIKGQSSTSEYDTMHTVPKRTNIIPNYSKALANAKLISVHHQPTVQFEIKKSEFVIGRSKKYADGCIDFNDTVSSKHCKFIIQNGEYYIVDLNSTNGTFVNSNRLNPNYPTILKDGDLIRIANVDFRFVK